MRVLDGDLSRDTALLSTKMSQKKDRIFSIVQPFRSFLMNLKKATEKGFKFCESSYCREGYLTKLN